LPRRIKAGFKLMQEAEANDTLRPLLRAGRFRDGLMLVLQSLVALRLYNLANIRIGEQLVETSEGYWLRFEAGEMKGRRPFEIPVPIDLNSYVARYLSFWRQVLLQGGATEALWLTQAGRAMQTYSVHGRMTKLTLRLFGKRMPTHLFRHGLASHIADVDPDHVRMAMPLLHHRQFRTTDGYIVKAGSLKASRSQNAHLRELRKELEQSCRQSDIIIATGDHARRGNSKRPRTRT
jgi:site-specific recombinase XerD